MSSKTQARAKKNNFLACRQRSPVCALLLLEIRPRLGQFPLWSEVWCGDCLELLLDLTSDVATSLLMISNYWYAKLNIHCVLTVEILDFYFRPMVIAAQGLHCQNWNNFPSVSWWSQVNILASFLKHQLCSHEINEIHEQQRSWNCLYVCRTINTGGTSQSYEQDSFFMSSEGAWSFLPDDLLVEDAVRVVSPEMDDNLSVVDPQIQRRGPVEIELGDGSSKFSAQSSYASSAYAR